MNPLVLIPARMAATRLPGKPLADILAGIRTSGFILAFLPATPRRRRGRPGPVAKAALACKRRARKNPPDRPSRPGLKNGMRRRA